MANINWLCTKCNTRNSNYITRCSFCSNPRPSPEQQKVIEETVAKKSVDKVKQDLHNAIEKMPANQRNKLWRYVEDNFI